MRTVTDVVLSAPAVTVAGASFLGYTLPEWAALVTIVYTLMLMVRMAWRAFKDHSKEPANEQDDQVPGAGG